ncbi:LRP2-binding protein-like [Oscarella lobularis]|uniref:LRP2-binding protein-like n=1 Tax=Oscarella lobularis TaxID=121494 RepID=UPI0033130B13
MDTSSEDELEQLKKRCETGDGNAIFQFGYYHFLREEYDDALPLFTRAADMGSHQALYQLAVMYYDGLGVEADPAKGVEIMTNIARSTNKRTQHLVPSAQYHVGKAYFEGHGVKQSDSAAFDWFLAAARDGEASGSVRAQSTLGLLYSRKDFLDLRAAFKWHRFAARNGSLESLGALGVMYDSGHGTRADPERALNCLKEAAERGNVYAAASLAAQYYRKKFYNKAVEIATRIANLEAADVDDVAARTECEPSYVRKGIAIACFYLSRCYHVGQGVDVSAEHARMLCAKAVEFDSALVARLHEEITVGL